MAMRRMECVGVCVFVFIILALLHHTVEAEMKKMDLAPDAVDYDFTECRDEMLKAVTGSDGLLQKELGADGKLKEMWNRNPGACEKKIPGGTSDHVRALHAYANSGNTFRKMFNDLVQSKGTNVTTYRDGFPYKSLYFLLMDSMRLLNSTNSCRTVYYGTRNTYAVDTGAEVRFGRFMRASKQKSSETEEVETEGTLFSITSCFVVNVEENLCRSEELEYIISPTEVFRVESVRDVSTNDDAYKTITLQHSRFLSNPSCPFFYRNTSDVGASTSLTFLLLAVTFSFLVGF